MSTIDHRPLHLNLWWYAAAAVLAGAVLALILATLQLTRPGSPDPGVDTSSRVTSDYRWDPSACRAWHPAPNIELPGCVRPVH